MLAGLGGSCFGLIGNFALAGVPAVDAWFHDSRHSVQVAGNTTVASTVPAVVLKFHVYFRDSSLRPAALGESCEKSFGLP